MTHIAFDPAYAKPVAYAYRTATGWRVDSLPPTLEGIRDILETAVERGVTGCVIEDGFMGINPRVSQRLAECRGKLRAHAEMFELPVVMVHPKTWQAACLSQGRWTPKTHSEIAAQARFRARGICGLDLNEDEACAVCMADWADSTVRERARIC